jgi:hypothetical protein
MSRKVDCVDTPLPFVLGVSRAVAVEAERVHL